VTDEYLLLIVLFTGINTV